MKCPYGCGWEGNPVDFSAHYEVCPTRVGKFGESSTNQNESSFRPVMPPGTEEWNGIKGFSAVIKDGEEMWTVQLRDTNDNNILVEKVMSITFEGFPKEPVPLIENVNITRTTQEAAVTGFPRIYGKATIVTTNFKGTVRARKEIFSLFFFYETLV